MISYIFSFYNLCTNILIFTSIITTLYVAYTHKQHMGVPSPRLLAGYKNFTRLTIEGNTSNNYIKYYYPRDYLEMLHIKHLSMG